MVKRSVIKSTAETASKLLDCSYLARGRVISSERQTMTIGAINSKATATFLLILLLLLLCIIMHGLYYGYHGGLNHAV